MMRGDALYRALVFVLVEYTHIGVPGLNIVGSQLHAVMLQR
jgi:hypothetical protein